MTPEDALIFFPHESSDDLTELYEEGLFEYKQFFISRKPSFKTFQGRLKKLEKFHEAYQTISGIQVKEQLNYPEVSYTDGIIKEIVLKHQEVSMNLRLALHKATNAPTILKIVKQMCVQEVNYAKCWKIDGLVENEILQNEIDPTLLLSEVNHQNSNGIIKYKDILKLDSNNILVQEAIRLSLYLKRELDV